MSRKSSAAKAVRIEPEVDDLPKSLNYRPSSRALNIRLREYLLEHGISFNEMCELAVTEFLDRNPRWQRRSLQLPRGKRPRL